MSGSDDIDPARGERFALARGRAALTQVKVARSVDAEKTTVHRWETGQTLPRARTLKRVAALYGVRHEWLAYGTGPMLAMPEAHVETASQERTSPAIQNAPPEQRVVRSVEASRWVAALLRAKGIVEESRTRALWERLDRARGLHDMTPELVEEIIDLWLQAEAGRSMHSARAAKQEAEARAAEQDAENERAGIIKQPKPKGRGPNNR